MTSMKDLPKDDEFSGVSFCQVDGDQVHEMKTVTYALLSWLKGLGHEDSIDISNESNHAQLELTVSLGLEDDEVDDSAQVFMNAYENRGILTYCAYPKAMTGLTNEQLDHVQQALAEINACESFGSFETFYYSTGEGGAIRFKAAVCMTGVLQGKVALVESLFEQSNISIAYGMNELISFLHG